MTELTDLPDWENAIEQARQKPTATPGPPPGAPTFLDDILNGDDGDLLDAGEAETASQGDPTGPPVTAPPAPKSANISDLFKGAYGDPETLYQRVESGELKEEELIRELSDPDSHLSQLKDALAGWTDQAKLLRKTIEELATKGDVLAPGIDKLANKVSKGKSFKEPQKLTGQEAVAMTIARLRGTMKIHLYNSGFWIVVKCPDNLELHEIMQAINAETKEYGRILGGHFFMLSHFYIVKKFCEILPSLVTDSNLKHWKKPAVLLNSIKLEDYDNILGGINALLFRDGVDFDMVCVNDECKYTETIHVDLNKLKIVNTSKIPEEALDILFSPEVLDKVRAEKYHALISTRKSIRIGELMDIELSSPSLLHYMKLTSGLFNSVVKAIGDKTSPLYTQKMYQQTVLNYYRQFLPWIVQCTLLKKNDDDVLVPDYYMEEPSAILEVLDANIWETHPEATKQLVEFISQSRLTFFAYVGKTCPKCTHAVKDLQTDWVPVDMNQFFFVLCSHRLSGVEST